MNASDERGRPAPPVAGGGEAGEPRDPSGEVVAALVALASLPGIGPATLLRCLDRGEPTAAWSAVVDGRPERTPALAPAVRALGADGVAAMVRVARATDPGTLLERHRSDGRMVLVRGGPGYPERLSHDPAPPALLFAQGDLTAVTAPTVAVVGTRNATRLGRELASELGAALAGAGVSVVSGLALGIDGAAHRGTLDQVGGSGLAVGVIGSGLDIAYPRRHLELHQSVIEHGLLLSETVLGERPSAWRFPARNRIIAGLADAVVVVESRSAGGSMLTVNEALARGISVLAVPGHPRAPAAAGPNDLIFDGAGVVRTPADVLEAIGITAIPVEASSTARAPQLSPVERAVLEAMGHTPVALAEVVARVSHDLGEVSAALVRLEASGAVVRSAGWFEAAGRAAERGGTRP